MPRLKRTIKQIEYDIKMQVKECCVCNLKKSFNDFYNSKNSRDKKSYRCIPCDDSARSSYRKNNPESSRLKSRGRQLKFKYGINLEDYFNLLQKQNGKCGICLIGENLSAYGKNVSPHFCIDHCHETNRIRGLLCNRCNRGLGLFKDDVNLLENALNYLKKIDKILNS